MLRRPIVWIPLLLVLLFGGAIIGGYTLLPGVVRAQGQAWVEKNLPGKLLTMGAIAFDPWTLTLDIADIAIADSKAPQAPLVALKAVTVDASLSSLWNGHARLDALAITAPMVDAVLRKDGSVNLAELVPPDDGSPVPEVWIGDLSVSGGRIAFTDERRAQPHKKMLTPVTFTLKDFSTRARKGGGFTFAAASEAGEKFAWAGTLGMAPVASQGRFTIGALRLETIGRFAGDLLPVAFSAGAIDAAGTYRFALPAAAPAAIKDAPLPAPQFDADLASLMLSDLAATAAGDRLAIRKLTIAPTQVSLAGDRLALGAVSIDGISIARARGERAAIAEATLAPTRYGITNGVAEIGATVLTGISVTGRGKGAETVALAGIGVAPSRIEMIPRKAVIGAINASGLRLGVRVAADDSFAIPGLYPLAMPTAVSATGPAWQLALGGLSLGDAAVRVAVARPTPLRGATFNLSPITLKLGPVTSALDAPVTLDLSTRIDGKAKLAIAGTASPASATADVTLDVAGVPLARLAALAPPTKVLVRAGSLQVKGRLRVAQGRNGPAPDFTGSMGVTDLDIVQRSDGGALIGWKSLDIIGIRYTASPQRLAIARAGQHNRSRQCLCL